MSISPFYTIHRYRDDVFKIVAFKGNRDPDAVFLRDREKENHYDNKLDCNFSRARSLVLQYALCNPWEYFFTGTLDKEKFDRFDLDTYSARLMQFIRDMRKKYKATLQVLLIPEHHEDGAWHIHGMINGLPREVLCRFTRPAPRKLVQGNFFNWPDYARRFGFCSLAPIRAPVATAYYISKYVSKDLSRRSGELGKHLYFHSRPLKKAEKASDIYQYDSRLDGFCTQEYDFCKTGMVDNAPWYFPYMWDGADYDVELMDPEPLEISSEFNPAEIDPFYEQLVLDEFRRKSLY